jgi:predicted cupin superfamily sugar epimerase
MVATRVADLVAQLDLAPHPEGGFFREIFRSSGRVLPGDERGRRAALTTIYYMLTEGQHSRWHRVLSDEVWHYYEGGPLELLQLDAETGRCEQLILGPLDRAARPVHAIRAGVWQAARPLGPYTLVGCTVGPGFDVADFSFMSAHPDAAARLLAGRSDLTRLL